ncbi:TPA: hypothetical protein DEW47_01275 [Patescibacteria group bacterium]|nr:MAG: hypothetical protein UT71_C0005G0020 [Parcubacteria group bacterium GW2011_GWF2_40_10]KKR47930.1 MAG: hypothetical protein UT83_C0002G0061 [Parcubacteria group bacterium GW2011_GWA2_40_143]KKR60378.1 MAG: hypothetical protein UT97_C0002G0078 [Parcubacteria group bacterium GW2011_GWC2_40_31]KKR75265.1 MAG: hypothetical protein UU18_C0009G0006 [Parcubacteria group bacterium GW2011_GWB2_40_8]KKR76661.1 MAG: hypothetical protein UU20_C0021G0005 [Parcubacteria group bacterium GW2011_GWE2_40_
MTREQETNIQKTVAAGGSFVLISDEKTPEESLLAKEALLTALKNINAKTYKLPENSRSSILKKWTDILPPFEEAPFFYSTSILIPKNKINLKEISYTEENGYVSIDINSSTERIKKEDIIFRHNPIQADIAFCFLRNDQSSSDETIFEELSEKISLPNRENIIFMEKGGRSIADKTFELIRAADNAGSYEETKIPSILLASLLVETDNLSGDLTAENLDLASTLIKIGADKRTVRNALAKENNQSLNRLFGRALARMTINEPLKSVWSFLQYADFEKSGTMGDDYETIYKIITRIGNIINSQKTIFLIWQDQQGNIRAGMNAKGSSETTTKLNAKMVMEEKNGLLISGPYKNFSEAEIKIKDMLKEIL